MSELVPAANPVLEQWDRYGEVNGRLIRIGARLDENKSSLPQLSQEQQEACLLSFMDLDLLELLFMALDESFDNFAVTTSSREVVPSLSEDGDVLCEQLVEDYGLTSESIVSGLFKCLAIQLDLIEIVVARLEGNVAKAGV